MFQAVIFVEQIFHRFDTDRNGTIDFKVCLRLESHNVTDIRQIDAIKVQMSKEFMLATNLSEANGPDDKLRMAFKMYDKDSSGELIFICLHFPPSPLYFILGTIEMAEMTEIVVNLFELEGIEKVGAKFESKH